MSVESMVSRIGLEPHHYELKKASVPVIDSHYYTVLGRQLFDLYQKYEVESEDQRKIESLTYLLSTFTLQPKSVSRLNFLRKWIRRS